MTLVQDLKYLQILHEITLIRFSDVFDSGHRLHFYSKNKVPKTSCSYTKDELIVLVHKSLSEKM